MEELEKHGMTDDEAGYQKVIEVLCVSTKEKRKVDELADTKTQLFVAAKLESQSQPDVNTRDPLAGDTSPPVLPAEEKKTDSNKSLSSLRRGTLVVARGATPENDLLGNLHQKSNSSLRR